MFKKMPVIETNRLILREIDYRDVDDMFEYASLPFVGPSAGWPPHTSKIETKLVIQSFIDKVRRNQPGVFAVVLKEENKMIGTVELRSYYPNHKAELGYTISPYYWGQGFATEASKAVIKWGFEDLNLKRIECLSFVDNYQSLRVCEKLGFKFECIRRKGYLRYDGNVFDVKCYVMTDDDYNELKKQFKY